MWFFKDAIDLFLGNYVIEEGRLAPRIDRGWKYLLVRKTFILFKHWENKCWTPVYHLFFASFLESGASLLPWFLLLFYFQKVNIFAWFLKSKNVAYMFLYLSRAKHREPTLSSILVWDGSSLLLFYFGKWSWICWLAQASASISTAQTIGFVE